MDAIPKSENPTSIDAFRPSDEIIAYNQIFYLELYNILTYLQITQMCDR